MNNTERGIPLRIPQDLRAIIDQQRGDLSQQAFILKQLYNTLETSLNARQDQTIRQAP